MYVDLTEGGEDKREEADDRKGSRFNLGEGW
jgi:hypothetical protein